MLLSVLLMIGLGLGMIFFVYPETKERKTEWTVAGIASVILLLGLIGM